MKMRRALFTPAALLLIAAMAGGTPAQAADALVPVEGIVSGDDGESVAFSGQAQISTRLAPDPDFGRPSLILTIDLGSVLGVGADTSARYVIQGQEILQRRVAASHQVEVTFPFTKRRNIGDLDTARSGVASFALSFDVNTGELTSATGNVSSPGF